MGRLAMYMSNSLSWYKICHLRANYLAKIQLKSTMFFVHYNCWNVWRTNSITNVTNHNNNNNNNNNQKKHNHSHTQTKKTKQKKSTSQNPKNKLRWWYFHSFYRVWEGPGFPPNHTPAPCSARVTLVLDPLLPLHHHRCRKRAANTYALQNSPQMR